MNDSSTLTAARDRLANLRDEMRLARDRIQAVTPGRGLLLRYQAALSDFHATVRAAGGDWFNEIERLGLSPDEAALNEGAAL